MYRNLASGKVQKPGEVGEATEQPEEYFVLVLPRILRFNGREYTVFDAVAECISVDSATYIWRAETGVTVWPDGQLDFTTWEEVFSLDRPHARRMGATTLSHPTTEQRAEDAELAAGMHRDLIVEQLTERLAFGRWLTTTRRNIGRGTLRSINERGGDR